MAEGVMWRGMTHDAVRGQRVGDGMFFLHITNGSKQTPQDGYRASTCN